MAKKVVVEFVDDLDGTPLAEDGESIKFAYESTTYAIDLNKNNADKFRALLAPYIDVAAKVGRIASGRGSRNTDTTKRSPEQLKAIRDWANANGHTVSSRGRIPTNIIEEFEKSH